MSFAVLTSAGEYGVGKFRLIEGVFMVEGWFGDDFFGREWYSENVVQCSCLF